MDDNHLIRYNGGLQSPTGSPLGQEPVAIDIPGAGLKRDYAGVLEYWQMIRRHKGAVIFATALGVFLGFLMTLRDPRIYQARTTLEIQGINQEFLNINMRSVSPTVDASGSDPDSDIQTQVRILQSRGLLGSVTSKIEAGKHLDDLQPPDRLGVWRKALKIRPPNSQQLWNQALNIAANGVRVRTSPTNRIVEVTCDSTSARLAVNFCNTLTQEFIDQNLESRWKTTEYTGQWLTKQLQDLKVKIERQEEELQAYVRETGLVFTGEKNDVDGQQVRVADLQKELSSAQADRIAKQSKYEMARSSPSDALPDVLDDASLKDSQHTLAELKSRLAQLDVTFTAGAPEVKRVQAQITAVEAGLEGARTNALMRIRKDYEAAQRREALLTSAYTAQAGVVAGQAEETAHYSLLKRDVDANRLLYDTLQQRLKEASIASALKANNIRVVDSAEQPSVPYKPDVPQRCITGLLFGLVIGVGFAVLRERADRTLQDPGDVSYHIGVPELGVVPVGDLMEMPGGAAARSRTKLPRRLGGSTGSGENGGRVEMVSWSQKTSLLAESFRTTLTSILFSRRGKGERPRVLVLTSASPKEGKTTVVSNIGIALAEINQRILVIDADMRRPRQHTVFNVENAYGLGDLLMSKEPLDAQQLEAACSHTSIPGLFLMPSGSAGSRRNASSLLHSTRLPELIALARQSFDTVVIDTPPMVNIADARVVARFGDALILIVRSGVTTRDAALLAKARFAEDGIPILVTILNFWNPKTPGYWYYRYYYAGYYHYYGAGSGNDDSNGNGKGNGNGNGHGNGHGRGPSDGSGSGPSPSRYAQRQPPAARRPTPARDIDAEVVSAETRPARSPMHKTGLNLTFHFRDTPPSKESRS